MKELQANQTYSDTAVGQDIPKGKIVNEVYEQLKVELTEEREKVLIAAGVVDIIEKEPITINPEAIVDPGEINLDDTISVEAKVIATESATATQENPEGEEKVEIPEVITSTGETTEDLKGPGEVNPEAPEVNPEGAEVNEEGAEVNEEETVVNEGEAVVNEEGAEVNPEAPEVNPEAVVDNKEDDNNVGDLKENKKENKKTSGNKAKQEKNSTIENE